MQNNKIHKKKHNCAENTTRCSTLACLTFSTTGSMRFRWNEENQIRKDFFSAFFGCDTQQSGDTYGKYSLVPLELIHSQIVIAVDEPGQTNLCRADGLITCNPSLVPILTVADCMPIYLWEPKTACFGVLHSGWKGTGIVAEALSLANKRYGAVATDFRIILGPHIGDCCYMVAEERAQYFIKNFTPDCVQVTKSDAAGKAQYRLSLQKANLALLEKLSIPHENITCIDECTCCTQNASEGFTYGSFRRETAALPKDMSLAEMHKRFTPMAAFMCMGAGMEEWEQADKEKVLCMKFEC